jgi:hypothetical protein
LRGGCVSLEQKAAESVQGPARRIFIEFLERSCTAEFSGFLLYKELGRRLKVRELGERETALCTGYQPLTPSVH